MSPYMKAYQAGVKLAKIQWASKYANEEDDDLIPTEGYEFSDEEVARGIQQLEDAEPQFGAPSMARGDQSSSMSLGGIDPSLLAFANRLQEAPAEAQAAQQAAPAAAQQAAPAAAQQAAPAAAQQAPEESGPRYDFRAINQEGVVDPEARFSVNKGDTNYRKLLNRFKEEYGGGQDDAFEGIGYRQFAQAMGNRGLRVGDSFNANDIMQRLNQFRQEQSGDLGPPRSDFGALDMQDARGRSVTRSTMQQQRARANRRSAANRRSSLAPLLETLNTTSVGPSLQDLTSGLAQEMGSGYEFAQQATPPAPRPPAPRRSAPRRSAPRRSAPRRSAPRRSAPIQTQVAEETPNLSTFQGRAGQQVTRGGTNQGRYQKRDGRRSYNVELNNMSEQEGAKEQAMNKGSLGANRRKQTTTNRQSGAFDQLNSLL